MIRTLLIDDEEPARQRLKRLLQSHPDIQVVGEAQYGRQALQKIAECGPDLVFLDIEMPLHSGIEVASAMAPPRPRIIFCTAFDSYALEAFEHNAVDYLLKPVNQRRLSQSLDRIREAHRQRLDSREIEEAGRTQRRLFPKLERPQTLDCHGSCSPARGVGGDYFDFIPLGGDRLGFAVGDVSGKGVYAGLLMAGLQGRLQSHAPRYQSDLKGLSAELNRQLWSSTDHHRYATLFYAVYPDDSGCLRYVNAGHPAGLLFRNAAVEKLESGGVPLGLFPDAAYADQQCSLEPGDCIVLCSDGVLEAENPSGVPYDLAGLIEAVEPHRHLTAQALHDTILEQFDGFRAGVAPRDDITLMVLKRPPRHTKEGSHW